MQFWKRIIPFIASIIVFLLIFIFVYYYRGSIYRIVRPFLIAVAIAYLVHPMAVRMERKGIRRGTGILLIYLGFSVFIVSAGIFIVPELLSNARELMETLPDIIAGYQNMFNGIIAFIRKSKWSEDVKGIVFSEINAVGASTQAYISDMMKRSLAVFIGTVTILFDVLVAMVIAYYFIKDASLFKRLVLSLVPRKWRNGITGTGRDINRILSNFIQGQLLVALIVGILETFGLIIAGVKYPLVLGLLGGMANIIPYFGPIIGAVPAVAVALIESPVKALWTVIIFIIIQQMDNTFISPRIIEGRLGLHPVATILAVMAGGEFFGIAGMLLSVPVAAVLRVVIKRGIDAIAG